MNEFSGFFFIDKPENCSSFDLIRDLRKKTSLRKFGHTGTLDPFASGLVIICLNKATKLSSLIINSDKEYLVKVELGTKTDTGDRDGKVIEQRDVVPPDNAKLKEAVKKIRKTTTQIPPSFSAKKINGQAAYKYARKGEIVELPAKNIRIYDFNVISAADKTIIYRAKVSKGTYLRTLSETLAEHLGTIAYTTDLRRLTVGNLSVKDAVKPELITADNWQQYLKSIEAFEWDYPVIHLHAEDAGRFLHGAALPVKINYDNFTDMDLADNADPANVPKVIVYSYPASLSPDGNSEKKCLGIAEIKKGVLTPLRVLG